MTLLPPFVSNFTVYEEDAEPPPPPPELLDLPPELEDDFVVDSVDGSTVELLDTTNEIDHVLALKSRSHQFSSGRNETRLV